MNRKQIIAELRRSATKDVKPWIEVATKAFFVQMTWRTWSRYENMGLNRTRNDHLRTYFLLVACALEDGQ